MDQKFEQAARKHLKARSNVRFRMKPITHLPTHFLVEITELSGATKEFMTTYRRTVPDMVTSIATTMDGNCLVEYNEESLWNCLTITNDRQQEEIRIFTKTEGAKLLYEQLKERFNQDGRVEEIHT